MKERLRSLWDDACRWPAVGKPSRALYWEVARAAARRLAGLPFVADVALRGGMVRGCRPGISDLDFTVRLADAPDAATEADRFALVLGAYRRMRSVLPLLGEPVVTTTARWNAFLKWSPAPALAHGRELRFDGGRWIERRFAVSAHGPGRFAAALDAFSLALRHHGRWIATGTAYGRKVMDKEIDKAAALVDATVAPGPPARRLAAIWSALHRWAERLALPPLPLSGGTAERLAVAEWIARGVPFAPRAEGDPALLWEDFDPLRAEAFVLAYERRLRELPRRCRGLAVLLLSPPMNACRSWGWTGWWAPPPRHRPELALNRFERLVHHLVALVPARLSPGAETEVLARFRENCLALAPRDGAEEILNFSGSRRWIGAIEAVRWAERWIAEREAEYLTQRVALAAP